MRRATSTANHLGHLQIGDLGIEKDSVQQERLELVPTAIRAEELGSSKGQKISAKETKRIAMEKKAFSETDIRRPISQAPRTITTEKKGKQKLRVR